MSPRLKPAKSAKKQRSKSAAPAPRPPGRPTKLTDEVEAQLVAKLKGGLPRRRAAWAIGLDEGTFSRWYRAGAADDAPPRLKDFRAAVERAEAEHQEELLRTATMDPSAKTALAILGRRYPDEWGRRDNVEPDDAEKKAADAAAVRQEVLDRFERIIRTSVPAPVAVVDVTPTPEPAPALPAEATPGGG